jgi:hypothetical protein
MLIGLLRILAKLVAAAAIILVSLTLVGDYLRQIVPTPYHPAMWKSGLVIFFPCTVGIVVIAQSPVAKPRRWQNLLIVGAATGALLFVLFITDIECVLTPRARGGMSLDCQYFGEP